MDDPIAYFLTWTTYGSWLPGDERGWVDKPGVFKEPDPKREETAHELLTESICSLDGEERLIVERTIMDHCRVRSWHLHAVRCMARHVHVVVTASDFPAAAVLNQFKSWCTRRLKERCASLGMKPREKWWTQRGSKRQLFGQTSLESACRYVLECQDLPRLSRLEA